MEPEGSLPYSQVPATCPYQHLYIQIKIKIWLHVSTLYELSTGQRT
jgi:hypothetical protein